MAAVAAVPEDTAFVPLPLLDLFEPRAVCNDTAYGHTESIYPEAGLGDRGGNITFRVIGTSDFIDPSKCYFVMEGKFEGTMPVTDSAGTTTDTDISTIQNPRFSWVNMLPHAIFKSVDVSINNQLITNNDTHYMFRNEIYTRLNNVQASLERYYSMAGYFKDQDDPEAYTEANNPALKLRRDTANDALTCFFAFDLATPFFQMNKALLSECDIVITLRKNDRPQFYMLHENAAKIDFKITNLVLKVRKIGPMDSKRLQIEQTLKSKGAVTYVMDDPRMIVTSIPQGETYIHREFATLGHHTKKILIAMVDTDAYNGHPQKNPFNFEHFNVSKVTLTKNGMIFPTPPITCNFETGNYVEAYRHLLASLHADKNVHVPHITFEDFKKGSFLLCWDMSADQYGCDDPQMLVNKSANIKLSVEFRRPLPKPITFLFFFQMEQRVLINQSRQVTLETVA
jgi:hypothetical protein